MTSIKAVLILSLVTAWSLGSAPNLAAQQPAPAGGKSTPVGARRGRRGAGPARRPDPSRAGSEQPPGASAAETRTLAPDYQFGEVNVTVKKNDPHPIIRLGLAQNGVTIVEFPVTDNFFYVHPGASDLITIDQLPSMATDHFLVFRPGSQFVAPPTGSRSRGPSASFEVQMKSGLIVTFLIYPVRDLSDNAHRVVVMYDRDEVVATRRAAGLAVNLGGAEPNPRAAAASVRPGQETGAPNSDRSLNPVTPPGRDSEKVVVTDVGAESATAGKHPGGRRKTVVDLGGAAHQALVAAMRDGAAFASWSDPRHGMSVSVAPALDLDDRRRVVIVAVRNSSESPLRLVPDQPDLSIETSDDRGRPLEVEQVKRIYVESTALGGKLPAGGTAYFALVYETPVLGAQQKLRVAIGEIDAADDPVTAALSPRAK